MASRRDPFASPPEGAPTELVPADLDDVLEDPLRSPVRRKLAPVTILVIGAILGWGLYSASGKKVESAIDTMLRLPVGCDTQLTIVQPGTFHVYIETKSSLPAVQGSCANGARSFDNTSTIPQIQMAVTTTNGENQPVYAERGETYTTSRYRGILFGRVRIPRAGTYVVKIRSNTPDAAIALGADVSEAGNTFKYGAYIVAALSLLIALIVRMIPRVLPEDDRYVGV